MKATAILEVHKDLLLGRLLLNVGLEKAQEIIMSCAAEANAEIRNCDDAPEDLCFEDACKDCIKMAMQEFIDKQP